MKNNSILKTAMLALSNFAANGVLGTAALTVDVASSLVITQTTAGVSVTLPSPTDTSFSDRLQVINAPASTVAINVAGVNLSPGEFAEFAWAGTAWAVNDGGRNTGAVVVMPTLVAGAFTVPHNMAMPTGSFSDFIVQIFDNNGRLVDIDRDVATDAANVAGFRTSVAMATPVTFRFTPLA